MYLIEKQKKREEEEKEFVVDINSLIEEDQQEQKKQKSSSLLHLFSSSSSETVETTTENRGSSFHVRNTARVCEFHPKLPLATKKAKEYALKFGLKEVGDPFSSFFSSSVTLPVFAKDFPKSASKEFLVASYDEFIKLLLHKKPENRNFYETILPNVPTHLHIDAEYNYGPNKDAKSSQWLEDTMLACIKELLKSMEIVENPEKQVRVIILESSNAKRFSRHYIIKLLNNKVFKNNYHCGSFIRRVEALILSRYGRKIETNPFYMWSADEKDFIFLPDKMNKHFFLDMTIYNIHRQFRTVGSVKSGEKDYANRVLRPMGTKSSFSVGDQEDKDRILDAMTQRVQDNAILISCLELTGEEPTTMGNSVAARSLRSLSDSSNISLTNPVISPVFNSSGNSKRPINSEEEKGRAEEEEIRTNPLFKKRKSTLDFRSVSLLDPDKELFEKGDDESSSSFSSSSSSSLPITTTVVIDDNQDNSISKNDSLGAVIKKQPSIIVNYADLCNSIQNDILGKYSNASPLGSLGYNVKEQLITFSSKSRQCLIANREHKSNHVYFVASLKRKGFYQRCTDPDCQQFALHTTTTTVVISFSEKTKQLVDGYLKRQDLSFQTYEVAKAMVLFLNFYELC